MVLECSHPYKAYTNVVIMSLMRQNLLIVKGTILNIPESVKWFPEQTNFIICEGVCTKHLDIYRQREKRCIGSIAL